ncbi:MAG: DUF642 domain-containing protein, partial [Planctomycetaceae bacterium]|nr:DUF642 domain-containing protein [Planctomycetaceae bacterium]
ETNFTIEGTPTDNSTVFSYAVSGEADELVLIVKVDGGIRLRLNGGSNLDSGTLYPQLFDGDQHHLAVSWDNANGDVALYLDGELIETFTGYESGTTISGSGADGFLTLGQRQGSQGGGFSSSDAFQGTLYDVRIWDEVRSEAEISLNYQQKFNSGSLPSGLVADWQMDGFNGSNEVVDVVSGNNLTIGHAGGGGFVSSTPVEDLHISENASDGTTVGYVVPSDPDAPQDLVSDGQFLEADTGSWTDYTQGQAFGAWTVESGAVSHTSQYDSPSGGVGLELQRVDGEFPSAITQTLTTEVGRQYQLIFNMTGNFSGGDPVKHLVASAGGVSANFSVTDTSTNGDVYEPRTLTFTADSTSTVLRFASGADDGWAAVITDVRVIEIPQAVSTILNNDSTLSYDAGTGKFYKVVSTGVDFATATSNANADSLKGIGGQLVTIRSEYENELIRSLTSEFGGNYHLGATDASTEGAWNWIDNGAESDRFWNGAAAGSAPSDAYANWYAGEPNDAGGGEDYAVFVSSTGLWADANGSDVIGYVIEWDAGEVLSNFTFRLTDDAGGRFGIDSNTGEITVADGSLLDYENATSHNVTVEVTDAVGNTYSEVMTITVDNLAETTQSIPVSTQNVTEDGTLTFSSGSGNAISVSDTLGSSDTQLQVFLSVDNGTLTLFQTTGLSIPGGADGSSFMTIQGTESAINAALEGITYSPGANYNGSDTLTVTTSMGAGLEGYYTFEGGTAVDQSVGVSQDGVLAGNTTTVIDGSRGEVLSLDGTDDYVSVSGRFGDPTQVTLAAWVNVDAADTNGSHVISLGNSVVLGVDRP